MRFVHRLFTPIIGAAILLAAGCEKSKPAQADIPSGPTILVAQAQFVDEVGPDGKTTSTPGPARLVILSQSGREWKRDVLEDPDCIVFHKAVFFTDPGDASAERGILTIAANWAPKPALAKIWHHTDDGWSAKTIWETTFGGKQNRLRDFEVGDVTGDGSPDIVIVTHDQGVVVVLTRSSDGWKATELDRKPGTWIHEVELADLDGDGLAEIYTTPSQPNRLNGTSQPGQIVAYRHTADGFERVVVESFAKRHPKEILAADIDGRPCLIAAVEADLGKEPNPQPDSDKVVLKRYRIEDGQYVGQEVCALPDKMCRFLNAGDLDGDGKPEVTASMHKIGLWMARPGPGQWKTELIERNSGGFEHATVLADLDGDGTQEIYVAADSQQQVCRYRRTDGRWQRDVLYDIENDKICFGITAGVW
ncbi:MAG TPA: VCBS repeat-containing protein [Phycisphaerae bacterium]|nr:VCBS repeat-containing protein [Phycisphaerae bacterium]